MASKKFKNKACAYCGRSDRPTEKEHVLAQQFVLKGTSVKEWPTAPACRRCNKEKSDLERYLTAAMMFAGQHADALANLEENGERRLAKHPELRAALAKRSMVWVRHGDLIVQRWAFDFDFEKLGKLCQLMAKGLAWHHWKVVLGADCFVEVHRPLTGQVGVEFKKFRRMRGVRETGSVGGDTFVYSGAQGTDNPQVTVWEFVLYGGQVASDAGDGRIGVLTGPRRILEKADLTSRWLRGTRLHG